MKTKKKEQWKNNMTMKLHDFLQKVILFSGKTQV